MFQGPEVVDLLIELGVSHVVWVPDSDFGQWEAALDASPVELVRVCREGEAWPLAAGLHLGGGVPLVVMQTTGLFESGDALRNVIFDMDLPLIALIGARNWLVDDSRDSAKRFAEPVVQAWGLDCVVIVEPAHKPRLVEHFRALREANKAGLILLAEGSG